MPVRSRTSGSTTSIPYVLHGPESGRGWSAADREVWSAMERLHRERRARLLGVSNISRDQLVTLCGSATVAPALVQNRCYARTGWDQEVPSGLSRARHRLPGVLPADRQPARAARSDRGGDRPPVGATIPQVVFRFAFAVGMVALTGTSDRTHMQQDLAALDLAITESDVAALERLR